MPKPRALKPGCLSLELGEAANRHGLCSLPGSSPDVGLVGYTLGGGLSWLGRQYGFACNRVSAIEVVAAGRRAAAVDADNDADLFWALRGGGGGYAIVTAMHLACRRSRALRRGALCPAEVGRRAVRAYREWASTVPDEVTSIVRFFDRRRSRRARGDPRQAAADPRRGLHRQPGRRREDVAPLREIGEPIMDTFGQIPPRALHGSTWTRAAGARARPPRPDRRAPRRRDRRVLGAVGPGGRLAAAARRAPAHRRRARPAGREREALDQLDGDYAMFALGMTMSPEMGQAVDGALDQLHETMSPWAGEGGYFNFAERAATSTRSSPPTPAGGWAR